MYVYLNIFLLRTEFLREFTDKLFTNQEASQYLSYSSLQDGCKIHEEQKTTVLFTRKTLSVGF